MFTKCYETFTRTYVWWETIPDGRSSSMECAAEVESLINGAKVMYFAVQVLANNRDLGNTFAFMLAY